MKNPIPTQRTEIGHPEQFEGPTLRTQAILNESFTPRTTTIAALINSLYSDGTGTESMPYAQKHRESREEPDDTSTETRTDFLFTAHDQQLLLDKLAEPDRYPTRRQIRQQERETYARNHKFARLGYLAISSILRAVSKNP